MKQIDIEKRFLLACLLNKAMESDEWTDEEKRYFRYFKQKIKDKKVFIAW